MHAEAEEKLFYPHLLKIGTGAGGRGQRRDEVEDVIKDHNEIRDAAAEAAGTRSAAMGGGRRWRRRNKANSDHMAEEEREDLVDFRRHADGSCGMTSRLRSPPSRRRHPTGVEARDKDPEEYVEQNS